MKKSFVFFCKIMFSQDTKDLLQGLPPPEVEVFCAHGSQVGRKIVSQHCQHTCFQSPGDNIHIHQVPTTEKLVYPEGSFPPASASWWSSGPTLIKVIVKLYHGIWTNSSFHSMQYNLIPRGMVMAQ